MEKPSILIMQTRGLEDSKALVSKIECGLTSLTGRPIDELVAFFEFGNFDIMSSFVDPHIPQLYLSGTYRGNTAPAIELAQKLKRISPTNLTCWGLTLMDDFPPEIFPHTINKLDVHQEGNLLQALILFALYTTSYEAKSIQQRQSFEAFFLERISRNSLINAYKKSMPFCKNK